MKYLTMIVALVPPGIAAFSEVHSKPQMKVGLSNSVPAGAPACEPRSSRSKTRQSMTQLQYRSGAEHEQKQASGSWWTSLWGEPSSAADDYLEFLDKRYSQILDTNTEEANEGASFSIMKWLHTPQQKETEPERVKERESDALYVLGISKELASEKFLQRHHMHSPQGSPSTSSSLSEAIVTDAEIVESTPTHVSAVVTVFRMVAKRREQLLQKQSNGVRLALAYIVQTLRSGPARASQALRKLYAAGGGKKSLAMTVAAVAALSILLRPLVRAVAVEGANTMSP